MSQSYDASKGRDGSPSSGDDAELGDVNININIKNKPREKAKMKGKVIRVLTVMAYVLSVSLAAIMLSLYYVFLWDPKMPGGGSAAPGRLQSDGNDGHALALQADGTPPFNSDVNASDASATVAAKQPAGLCR